MPIPACETHTFGGFWAGRRMGQVWAVRQGRQERSRRSRRPRARLKVDHSRARKCIGQPNNFRYVGLTLAKAVVAGLELEDVVRIIEPAAAAR
jgi:hypothetical protein